MSSSKGSLDDFQLHSLDTLFRLRGPIPYDSRIIIIEIDDQNITGVGRWPWPRKWHAALINALDYFGAQSIYFDMIFSEDSSPEDDAVFAQAIKKSKNVYLPFVFKDQTIDIANTFSPIPTLARSVKGVGSINIYPDADGSFRRIPLIFKQGDRAYPHVALKIAMDVLDGEISYADPSCLTILSPQGEGAVKIPLINESSMLINWADKWKDTFKHYSYLDVLNAYNDIASGKKAKIDIAPFKNSICLVGITAIGLYELKPVPLEPVYPGIGIMATATSNILNRAFIRIIPAWIIMLLVCLLPLIPAILISGERPLRAIVLTASCAVTVFISSLVLFKNSILFNFSLPLLSLGGSYLGVATYNFVRISIEKQRFFRLSINDGLTGLFNIRYFKMVLRTECLMANADPSKHFCILMCDVDHFKKFNDTYGHQVGDLVLKGVASVLKKAVRASDVVARYGGEEMIMLLRSAALSNALMVAERTRHDIESNLIKDKDNKEHKVTISMGASRFIKGDSEDTVIERADKGLYKAKESGRNRVETIEK